MEAPAPEGTSKDDLKEMLLNHIEDYQRYNDGKSPSVRKIASHVGRKKSYVQDLIDELVRSNRLGRQRYVPGSLRVFKPEGEGK